MQNREEEFSSKKHKDRRTVMFKHSEKLPIVISVILGALFICALVFMCSWLPVVVNSLIDVSDNFGNRNEITAAGRIFTIADAYAMVALAFVAVILLFVLLSVVYNKNVFSKKTSRLLSAISWCCFGEGLLSLLLIVYFQLAICITLAACFLGLCLRVVRHVIEEATNIKQENDFTI